VYFGILTTKTIQISPQRWWRWFCASCL